MTFEFDHSPRVDWLLGTPCQLQPCEHAGAKPTARIYGQVRPPYDFRANSFTPQGSFVLKQSQRIDVISNEYC